jgi:biotin carboxylase
MGRVGRLFMKRVLILAATTGYQTRMFGAAAERLGVQLVFATDRCDQLEDPWSDGAIAVRFHQEAGAAGAIVAAARVAPFAGLVAVGDRPTVVAARVARQLGLAGHPPHAASAARDKRIMREHFRSAGMLVPWFRVVKRTANPRAIAAELAWPVVVKPTVLAGSRGVIRANLAPEFIAAFERVQRLLAAADVRAMQDPAADEILIEQFIDGTEYALEGLLDHGELRTLAIFDKPDPLDGPFFEETLYVTPSRAAHSTQDAIEQTVAAAVRALGLSHGPIHAECRVNSRGVFVLEVAARPIGGLCAYALHFTGSDGATIGLEELILRHAIGEDTASWQRGPDASGVMMIPIPGAGIFRRASGVEDAMRVAGVHDVRITAKPDQRLVPLPEGASYLGFIFARADSPERVEAALREAHGRLSFVIDRPIAVTTASA